MNATDIQKMFLRKNGDTSSGVLRVVSEGSPERLLQEDNVLFVALKMIAQKKAHRKWCWVILAYDKYKDIHQPVTLPNLKIEIVRPISKKQKRELYRSANVFVASKEFGTTSIEAMAFGVPVVQMNNFRLDAFVENGKNCLLVPVNDPKALALALERVLVDSDLADHLRVGGTLTACTNHILEDYTKASPVTSDVQSMSFAGSMNMRHSTQNRFPSLSPTTALYASYSVPPVDGKKFQK